MRLPSGSSSLPLRKTSVPMPGLVYVKLRKSVERILGPRFGGSFAGELAAGSGGKTPAPAYQSATLIPLVVLPASTFTGISAWFRQVFLNPHGTARDQPPAVPGASSV